MRRVTVNLPRELLDEAMKVTGKSITETIVEGLAQIRRRCFYDRAMSLRGKVKLDIDLDAARGRRLS